MKRIATLAITTLIAAALPAQAGLPFGLGFEGMQVQGQNGVYPSVLVDDFYAGGSSKDRTDPSLSVVQGGAANDFGVTFGAAAVGLRSINEGQGTGSFGPRFLNTRPSDPADPPAAGNGSLITGLGVAAMRLASDVPSEDVLLVLNIPSGFGTALSFYYASIPRITVEVFDLVDGKGTLIGSDQFNGTDTNCGIGFDTFCVWSIGAVGLQGTARSIRLGGVDNQTFFDNVTFGSRTPIDGGGGTPAPEPGSFALAALGLLGAGAVVRRKQRRS